LIDKKRNQITNYGGADLNLREAILLARDIGITKQELIRLKSMSPEDITNLESAIGKLNEFEKSEVEHTKEDEETKKEAKIKMLDQIDDESLEILEKEALSRLSKEDLQLMLQLDKSLLDKLKKIEINILEIISNNWDKALIIWENLINLSK